MLAGGRVRLNGTSWVGRAVCDGVVLECREKVGGALVSLLTATDPDLKIVQTPTSSTNIGTSIQILIRAFLDDVLRYLGDGRDWVYIPQISTSSLISGRLDVTRTARLHSRGLRHLATFERHEITRSTHKNRVIYAALREIESIHCIFPVRPETLNNARGVSQIFEDCWDPTSVMGVPTFTDEEIDILVKNEGNAASGRMLRLAQALLAHRSAEVGPASKSEVPLSWFVNLESLFEKLVRDRIRITLKSAVVTSPRSHSVHLFPESKIFSANPDVVIRSNSSVAIGDVKYKNWSRRAAHSDIYQLLAHATAFRSNFAFLVFPADVNDYVDYGMTASGVQATLFSVDINDIDSGINLIVNRVEQVLCFDGAVGTDPNFGKLTRQRVAAVKG